MAALRIAFLKPDHGVAGGLEAVVSELEAIARADGHEVTAQVAGRPFGVLFSLQARHHFADLPGFAHLVEASASERASIPSRRASLP